MVLDLSDTVEVSSWFFVSCFRVSDGFVFAGVMGW